MTNFNTVVDKTVGDVFSELMWDTYIKDNLNKGVSRPLAYAAPLGAPAASIDVTSIDQNFGALRILAFLRTNGVVTADALSIRFNNDSGANYDYQRLSAANATISAAATAAATAGRAGAYPGASDGASRFGAIEIFIPYYTGVTNFKSYNALSSAIDSSAANSQIEQTSGLWRSTAAINRVTVLPSSGSFIADCWLVVMGEPF